VEGGADRLQRPVRGDGGRSRLGYCWGSRVRAGGRRRVGSGGRPWVGGRGRGTRSAAETFLEFLAAVAKGSGGGSRPAGGPTRPEGRPLGSGRARRRQCRGRGGG